MDFLKQEANKISILDYLRHGLFKIHRWSQLRPRWTILITGLLLLSSLGLASRLQFLLSIDDLIDTDFKTYSNLKKVNDSFHDRNAIFVSLESEQLFTKDYLCNLQSWVLDVAGKRGDLLEITSSFGVPEVQNSTHEFRMLSALGLHCTNPGDPEKEKISSGLALIRRSPWKDVLGLGQTYGLTLNFLVNDPQNKKYGSIDTRVVDELQSSYQQSLGIRFPDVHTFWGGVTAYQSHLRKTFDQTQALNSLMFVVTLLLFRLFFGSWRLGILFNTSALITFLITYGFMGAVQIPIDGLTNSVGLMVMLACLEDFIFISYGMQKMGWTLRKSLRVFLIPSFFTTLTTAIGFGSLITSDLGIIRRFGLASGASALIEWGVVFLTFPAILKLFPRSRLFQIPKTKWKWALHDPIKFRSRRLWAWVLVVVAIVPLVQIGRLHVNDSPAEFFSKKHIANVTLDHLLATRGWVNEVSLLLKPELSSAEEETLLQQVQRLPHVHHIETAQEVKKFLGQGLDGPDQRLTERIWDNSHSAQRLEAVNGTRRAQVFLDTMDMDQVRSVIHSVDSFCPKEECALVGSLISYNEFSTRVLQTLFSSLGVSLLLVGLIILGISRHLSWRERAACLIASAWGPLCLLALFILFNIPLFFVTCVCASVLVGLAGDNAIQFILKAQRKGQSGVSQAVDQLGDASLILTISMIAITAIFFFSEMAPLVKLGGIMILGFTLGYIGDVFVLKGLLKDRSSSPWR
jgi:predicted RND superfamily exporter protein